MQLKQHKSDVALTASNEILCNTLNLCFPSDSKAIFLLFSHQSSQLTCFDTILDKEFLQAQIYGSYYLPYPVRAVDAMSALCYKKVPKRTVRSCARGVKANDEQKEEIFVYNLTL